MFQYFTFFEQLRFHAQLLSMKNSFKTLVPGPPMFQSRRVDRKDKEAVKEANMYYSIESGEL